MNILNQFDLQKLFHFDYLLEANPSSDGLYPYLAIVFGLFLLVSFILVLKAKKSLLYKKLNLKSANLFFWIGLLGLGLLFCRWQGIPYLGSRIVIVSLAGVFIIWGLIILRYKIFIVPREVKEYYKQKMFEKYLPGPNKKENK